MDEKTDLKASNEQIGSRLRTAREIRGMTQLALANRIGADPQNYSKIERGEQTTNTHFLAALCAVLRVSADWVLLGRGDPPEAGKAHESSKGGVWPSLRSFLEDSQVSDDEREHLEAASALYSADPGDGAWLQHLGILRTISARR